jgi:hypothetical protein
MKHIPILFSDEMVKAVLAGDKVETRRLVGNTKPGRNPWGDPGDLLWVRETHYCWGQWVKNGLTARGRQKWRFVADDSGGRAILCYSDDNPANWSKVVVRPNSYRGFGIYKRLGRFLPKKHARLWLERTERLRTEKLQDITDAGAKNEGVKRVFCQYTDGSGQGFWSHTVPFLQLWDKLHAEQGHGASTNPEVFVITFKKTKYKTKQD